VVLYEGVREGWERGRVGRGWEDGREGREGRLGRGAQVGRGERERGGRGEGAAGGLPKVDGIAVLSFHRFSTFSLIQSLKR
jgi:hypothetical protein